MIFATFKESLIQALDRVSPIVKSNPRTVDILQSVVLETVGDSVFVSATSPMASVRVRIKKAVPTESGRITVSFEKLRDRVGKSGEKILLEAVNGTLKITSSDDQRLGIPLSDIREFPNLEWVEQEESYGIDVADLVTLFRRARSITSTATPLSPRFLQVHIVNQTLWAANNVSYQKFPVPCNPALDARIPNETLSALVSFIKDSGEERVWLSQEGNRHMVVTVGQDQFQAVALAVEFPDLTQTFQHAAIRMDSSLKVSRARMVEELTKARTSTDSFGRVTLTIKETPISVLEISTESGKGDWYESTISGCIWDGEPNRSFTFNLETLLNFVQSFKEEYLLLEVGDDFKGDLSPLMCQEGDHVGILSRLSV